MSPSLSQPRLVLASASPRRAELLRSIGASFEVVPTDIDESQKAGESPAAYVERLAREKAERAAGLRPAVFVLAADTTVVVDGDILGKPTDAADAVGMLQRLSGRSHHVLTGVCLVGPDGVRRETVAATGVAFGQLTAQQIEAYVATGEPMDKAGAYGIQGLAAQFVTGVEGSYSNVVGLPIEVVSAWCRELDIILQPRSL